MPQNRSQLLDELRASEALPDLILPDINMPKKTGFDATRLLNNWHTFVVRIRKSADAMDPGEMRRPTILVAEDDEDDFYIFFLALQETGLPVTLLRAENGDRLMAMLHERVPDILFLDLDMPCKNGQQCLSEIRSDKRLDALPVVIYSSFDDARHVEYCFRHGANQYLVKPYGFSELVTAMKNVLTHDWTRPLDRSEF
jgi:CheY-like chemotaxis protein